MRILRVPQTTGNTYHLIGEMWETSTAHGAFPKTITFRKSRTIISQDGSSDQAIQIFFPRHDQRQRGNNRVLHQLRRRLLPVNQERTLTGPLHM